MSSTLLETIYLPTLENYSYSEAREFSRNLDLKLGFRIEQVEAEISRRFPHTPWAGLDPQALQTPYPEIRMILSRLNLQVGNTVVDFGAAYGRMGLVMAHFFPGTKFIGYEISEERAGEGNRILSRLAEEMNMDFGRPKLDVQLLREDISRTDFILPEAEIYFLYDFGDLESIVRVIDRMREMSMKRRIVVVGRGRRTRDQIERREPWLSQINPPEHCGNFSIYRS